MANGKDWIIRILVIVALAAIAAAVAFGDFRGETNKQVEHNHEAIEKIEPKVELNTEFRVKTTEKLIALDKSVENNTEAVKENTQVQQKILLELKK